MSCGDGVWLRYICTCQWHQTMHINWRDNSSMAANVLMSLTVVMFWGDYITHCSWQWCYFAVVAGAADSASWRTSTAAWRPSAEDLLDVFRHHRRSPESDWDDRLSSSSSVCRWRHAAFWADAASPASGWLLAFVYTKQAYNHECGKICTLLSTPLTLF